MRICLLLLAILSVILVSTGGATDPPRDRYVAADGRMMVWCSAGPHSLVETPECAGAELNNAVNELDGNERQGFGIGGFVKEYGAEDALTPVFVAPEDDLTGSDVFLILSGPASESTGERQVSEGCGPRSITIPADPVGRIVGRIPVLGVSDDLDVCGATTGTV